METMQTSRPMPVNDPDRIIETWPLDLMTPKDLLINAPRRYLVRSRPLHQPNLSSAKFVANHETFSSHSGCLSLLCSQQRRIQRHLCPPSRFCHALLPSKRVPVARNIGRCRNSDKTRNHSKRQSRNHRQPVWANGVFCRTSYKTGNPS